MRWRTVHQIRVGSNVAAAAETVDPHMSVRRCEPVLAFTVSADRLLNFVDAAVGYLCSGLCCLLLPIRGCLITILPRRL